MPATVALYLLLSFFSSFATVETAQHLARLLNASDATKVTISITRTSEWEGAGDLAYAGGNDIILYRGINQYHRAYSYAQLGIAMPRLGTASPLEHIHGNTRSGYTSWTSNIMVAWEFATHSSSMGRCNGIILVTTLNTQLMEGKEVIPTASLPEGDLYGEDEYLIFGPVYGCMVVPVYYDPANLKKQLHFLENAIKAVAEVNSGM